MFKFTSPFWTFYSVFDILKVIGVAFLLTVILTPVAKWTAYKIGAIDVPKDGRRMHKKPIPRLGGMAIFISVVITMTINVRFDSPTDLQAILAGAVILFFLGIADDTKALPAKFKLLVQIVAVLIPVLGGVRITMISNPFVATGITILPDWLSILVTMAWMIGTTNAVNLIDGLDGLAAGISCIGSFFIGYIAFKNQQFEAFWMAMALAGGCLGFLPFNFNPAKIFMGDTGSTFLGYMLAIISVHGAVKGSATLIVLVPLLILGLPIFDTAFAIMRRALNGKPIMSPDRGHLHHRLIDKGLSQKQAVSVMYTISVILGILAIVVYKLEYKSSVIRKTLFIASPIILAAVIFMYIKVISIKPEESKTEVKAESEETK